MTVDFAERPKEPDLVTHVKSACTITVNEELLYEFNERGLFGKNKNIDPDPSTSGLLCKSASMLFLSKPYNFHARNDVKKIKFNSTPVGVPSTKIPKSLSKSSLNNSKKSLTASTAKSADLALAGPDHAKNKVSEEVLLLSRRAAGRRAVRYLRSISRSRPIRAESLGKKINPVAEGRALEGGN
jgi:hypothetical protein